jgi:hypothetical protein
MYENEITMKLKELPDTLKKEILDYVNVLLAKEQIPIAKNKGFKFLWENGLAKEKIGLTSVELQHKSMEWR